MELLALAALAFVLGIPAAALYAVYRVSKLDADVTRLRDEVSSLNKRVRLMASGPRAQQRADRPDPAARERQPDAPAGRPPVTHAEEPPARPAASRTDPVRAPSAPESVSAATGKVSDAQEEVRADRESGTGKPEDAPGGVGANDGSSPGTSAPGPRPSPESPKTGLDLETLIGSTWLLRIGLGVLAIALALFARSVAPQLPNAAKVALAYAASIALFGFGRYFEDRLERFARPVMAGGLAFGFFVAFSAHFVPAMQAVTMPVSIVWMFVSMLTILVAAERWQSESTAILAIVLGHIAAQVSAGQADGWSLILIGFLGVTAILMLLRHRWVNLGLVGVAGSYGSHLLWLLADRAPPVGDSGFWLSLAFLTSYYVIFLIADLLWWRRAKEPGAATLRSARALGPLNLVLYVSLTTFVYFVSGASVASVEWYFLSLGALQGVLAWLYRAADHEDYVFYPVFGTVLWTLGMFAALDALALNLVLSAQALILLFAARRTGLTVFYWLAQAAMATAFVHFLVVPPPNPPTLGAFLGGLGVAAVYYVKACLEEDWYRLQAFLPPAHAALGSIVVLAHGIAYFRGSAGFGILLAAVFVLLVAVAALRGRHAILFGATALAAALPLLTAGHAPSTLLLPSIVFALGAMALTWVVPQRFAESDATSGRRQTQTVVIAVLLAVVLAGSGFSGSLLEYLAWMLVPVILLVAQSRLLGEDTHERLPLAVNLGIALAVVVLTDAAFAVAHLPPVWIATWAALAMIAAARLDRRAFAETGYGILFGGYVYFLGLGVLGAPPSSHPVFGIWWAGAIVALTPFMIGIGLDRHMTRSTGAVSGSVDAADPGVARSRLEGVSLPLAPTLMGLLLVGSYAAAQLSIGFGYVVPGAVALLLVHLGDRIPARRALVAALAAALALHVAFLMTVGWRPGIEAALPLLLVFAVITLAIERGAGPLLVEPEGDHKAAAPALTAIVVLAAGTAMTAMYLSLLVGPAWATAGWSLVGGSMMAAGFYFRAATYRRVGLVVLGVCLVRVFTVDTVGLSDTARIGAFLVLGLMLVGIALLYSRYSSELKDWL